MPLAALARGWPLLRPSGSVAFQFGPLPSGGIVRPAPPPPHVKSSGSNMPPTLRLGPTCSNGKVRPAGTSVKGRALQIACRALLLRWIGMTPPWLWAAYSKVPGGYAWSGFRGRTGLIWGEGRRAHLFPHACEKGHPRPRQRHKWGRARVGRPAGHIRELDVGLLGLLAAVWQPSPG